MNRIEKRLFEKYPNTQVTFINKKDNLSWVKWKKWNECSEQEKIEANLRQIFPEECVLDFENKEIVEANIKKLKDKEWGYEIFDSGSRGIHIHIFFGNLEGYSAEVRNQIRKKIIKEFGSDETKSSEATLVARLDKPHFKTMIKKTLIESEDKFNIVPKEIILELREANLQTREFISKLNLQDESFKDFHLKDPMFLYISNNVIPDGTFRDTTIFPSIAMGLVKEGLNEHQIEEIMTPIIKANFPGKIYNEFRGWVNKAMRGEVDFNPVQLNNWIKEHTSYEKIYDLDPIKVQTVSGDSKIETFINVYDYVKQPRKPNKWLVKDWISEGDICFIHGKAGSFKSTVTAHICYAICTNDLVFNKYETQTGTVLYFNAENHYNIMIPLLDRVTKGMSIEEKEEKIKQIKERFFITAEKCRFKLDKLGDSEKIIALAKQCNANVIILDSYRRFYSGKENDSDVSTKMFDEFEKIRRECNNATIIAIAHDKKNDNGEARDAMRGTGDTISWGDSTIQVKRREGKNYVTLFQGKNRGGQEKNNVKIMLDDKNDGFYLWEVEEKNKDAIEGRSKLDIASMKILELSEVKNLKEFAWKELTEIKNNFGVSHETIKKALRELKETGAITTSGDTTCLRYIFA